MLLSFWLAESGNNFSLPPKTLSSPWPISGSPILQDLALQEKEKLYLEMRHLYFYGAIWVGGEHADVQVIEK